MEGYFPIVELFHVFSSVLQRFLSQLNGSLHYLHEFLGRLVSDLFAVFTSNIWLLAEIEHERGSIHLRKWVFGYGRTWLERAIQPNHSVDGLCRDRDIVQ